MTFGDDKAVIHLRRRLSRESDEELVAALKAGGIDAAARLYERYAVRVRRVLVRLLGMDEELPDLINEVFTQALKSIKSIQDESKLEAWITRIAVFVARKCIRGRQRKRWLTFKPPEELPPIADRPEFDETSKDLFRAVRSVLVQMPAEGQIMFSLRFFEEMEIGELAEVCGISLSTAKRRLAKCETLFKSLAGEYPLLRERLDNSSKWRRR